MTHNLCKWKRGAFLQQNQACTYLQIRNSLWQISHGMQTSSGQQPSPACKWLCWVYWWPELFCDAWTQAGRFSPVLAAKYFRRFDISDQVEVLCVQVKMSALVCLGWMQSMCLLMCASSKCMNCKVQLEKRLLCHCNYFPCLFLEKCVDWLMSWCVTGTFKLKLAVFCHFCHPVWKVFLPLP